MSLASLQPWQQGATKAARRLVLSIIASQNPAPTVHQIFKLAVHRESAGSGISPSNSDQHIAPTSEQPPLPRYPNHVIRSMK